MEDLTVSLRIAHNVEAVATHRALDVSATQMAQAMKRLSSGLRINSAADDAAGLGISERMRSQISGLAQARRNTQDGISMLQTMDGALAEVHSILQRARELAIQFNNGTYSWADLANIDKEWAQLSNEIGRIEGSTQFNGLPLLQSATTTVTLQVGANDGEQITVSLVDLMGPGLNLVRPVTFFALPWIGSDIVGFDQHIDDVAEARARIGAVQNRLEHTLNDIDSKQQAYMDAESRIRNTDMAEEMVNLTKAQITQQVASTMAIFSNHNPRKMMSLLGLGGDGGGSSYGLA
jgi:flagellin